MAIKRITTNLIKDSDIATVDIANNAITAAKITDGNITTAKLADLSVTAGKLAGTLDLTGKTITVATATTGDSDTSPASTAFVQQEIAALVDSSPDSLNTLNELAAALGDDASFSTTVTNSIATKLPLAGGTLTGALVVTADANPALEISRGSANTTNVNLKYNTTLTGQLSAANAEFQISAAGSSTPMEFFTNGSERMRIDSSGNLLLGTTSFNTGAFGAAKGINVSATQPLILVHESDTDKDGYMGISNSVMFLGTADAIPLRFSTNDAERMRIDSSGHVGIGMTPAPVGSDTVLSIYNSATPRIKLHNSTTGTSSSDGGEINMSSSDLIIENREAGNQRFFTNGAERMRITSSGGLEVGDGTNYGYVKVINDSAVVQYLDRRGSDGIVLEIRHADSKDGQINTLSGRMAIGSDDTGIFFDSTRDCLSPFTMTGNDGRDGGIDIGRDAVRFKDFYLTGIIDLENAFRIRSQSGQTGTLGFNRNPADGTHLGQSGLNRYQINGPFSGSDFLDFQNYNSSGTYTGGFRVVEGSIQGYPQVVSKPTYSFIGDSNTGMTRPTGDTLQFVTGGSERMRINSSGQVLVGTSTNPTYNHKLVASGNACIDGVLRVEDIDGTVALSNCVLGLAYPNDSDATSGYFIYMTDANGAIGSIQAASGTSVSFNTTSDERLKKNIVNASPQLDIIKSVKVREFDWKRNDHHELGLIAQEIKDIIPNVVSEGGDDETKNPYGVDYGKLTPYLIKAIQEQQTIIDDLKSRIDEAGL